MTCLFFNKIYIEVLNLVILNYESSNIAKIGQNYTPAQKTNKQKTTRAKKKKKTTTNIKKIT